MEEHLADARLQSIIPKLDNLGVHDMEEFPCLAVFDWYPAECFVRFRLSFESMHRSERTC